MRVDVYAGDGFAVFINAEAIDAMTRASDEAHPNETTGPLFGILTGGTEGGKHPAATIMEAPVAVLASSPTDCVFDGNLASRMADERWREHQHIMLGEWHSHPNNTPTPSPVDIQRCKRNVTNPEMNMPEEIMVIVGGPPGNHEWSVHVITAKAVHKLERVNLH
ncbi:hypothetical protein EKK58_05285 [Candidatus Dependentiae bacterium]|nr:MAG: hypothetical protein EKK58_05285 [Candidatus Dependentiae bacterium]